MPETKGIQNFGSLVLQKAKKSDADEGAEEEQEEEGGEGSMEQDEDDEKPLVAMVQLLHALPFGCTALCALTVLPKHLLFN